LSVEERLAGGNVAAEAGGEPAVDGPRLRAVVVDG